MLKHTKNMCSPRSSAFVARHANHQATISGRARLEITVHIEETIRVSVTSIFAFRVNCDLHLSVFGTGTFSSDKRSIDISEIL